MKKLSITLMIGMICLSVMAQEKPVNNDIRINLLFGLNQPMLGGFNVEGNLFYKRLAFDYSHGVSLDFENKILSGAPKEQGLAVHIPWTTGFGVGYRFNEWLNLRVEPKWHKHEIYYDGVPQNENTMLFDYTTFTLGLGLYANVRPFKNKENFLKGLMIAPSVRFWPQVASTLTDDQITYENIITGQTEVHEAMEIGISNTPWIVNVSVGYSFGK